MEEQNEAMSESLVAVPKKPEKTPWQLEKERKEREHERRLAIQLDSQRKKRRQKNKRARDSRKQNR